MNVYHSKQSHGTVHVGKCMYICFGRYTIKILCIPLVCMCTQYTVIGKNISPNYSNNKNDIFIGKQDIIIYYELIPQIKYIVSFNIAQGILIINTFFLIWCLLLFTGVIASCYTCIFNCTVDLNSKYGSENNITFLHSNICSSEKKMKDLSYYLESFDMTFTFIGLCETWATKTNIDLLSMPGYNHEHCIRSNKKGGGVTIYILNTIKYKVRKNLSPVKTFI